jgi:hypothetical protein
VNARVVASVAIVLCALLLGGCGGGDDGESEGTVSDETATVATDEGAREDAAQGGEPAVERGTGGRPAGEAADEPAHSGPSAEELRERAVIRVVRDYIDALVDHDGARVCMLFAPGALDSLELPVARGDCASSLTRSIGYRDPRGIPWRDTEIQEFGDVSAPSPNEARATVNVITHFAGDREPSIEDDVVYLERSGGRWRIVQPSTTIYRAVGIAEIPLDAIKPP